MTREYTPDELLPLSGIQHFLFCRRQWALIHIEMQWQDNALTVEGKQLHERVDDPFFVETRRDVIISRSVPVASYTLGLSGICDVVEFTSSTEGIRLPGREGFYRPTPIEYKRGHPKRDPVDEAQLCAQAICLEEMLAIDIPFGYLYYGETRRREPVTFTRELRQLVYQAATEMHAYMARGYTPRVKVSKACRSCSLAAICLPNLQEKTSSVKTYIRQQIEQA
ncbi:CRISPR-associated protein Cas4 [Chloroflexus sp. Y-396-1]|uniref:CRISPR-associated protein Cas4 n=1 Tax=Chloroflexus sp. Y-396-1 TaxID=867845 RepID=UPI00048C423A